VGAILKQIENKVAVLAVFRKSAAQLIHRMKAESHSARWATECSAGSIGPMREVVFSRNERSWVRTRPKLYFLCGFQGPKQFVIGGPTTIGCIIISIVTLSW
jgi:hypothetical protein